MKKVGIVYLITESPEARGVLEAVTEKKRKTYCEEKSLGTTEIYQARASGFNPVYKLILPLDFEYRGETKCIYKGERFNIYRDYSDDKSPQTELTLERERGNAARPVPAQAPTPTPTPDMEEEEPADETEGSEDV